MSLGHETLIIGNLYYPCRKHFSSHSCCSRHGLWIAFTVVCLSRESVTLKLGCPLWWNYSDSPLKIFPFIPCSTVAKQAHLLPRKIIRHCSYYIAGKQHQGSYFHYLFLSISTPSHSLPLAFYFPVLRLHVLNMSCQHSNLLTQPIWWEAVDTDTQVIIAS